MTMRVVRTCVAMERSLGLLNAHDDDERAGRSGAAGEGPGRAPEGVRDSARDWDRELCGLGGDGGERDAIDGGPEACRWRALNLDRDSRAAADRRHMQNA